ncbi:MAG: putative Ig domain-containing protein, partial [Candidatus Poseidoniaceae archaeon]
MSSVASPFTTRRAILLVALMVLMGQAGYFQSGYWMNGEDSTPVEPLAMTTGGPMATFSTDMFPSIDADLRAGDLSDWTFWRPNATDASGYRGGFAPFNSALPDSNGDGQAYYAGHGSAFTASSSQLGGTSVTDGMLLFTHYELDNGAVHTASANLSLNLPASAFLSFTAVTMSDGWNDSFLDVAVHQSGSQISHTTVEPDSASLRSERVTVFVPAGSSTLTISTSVEGIGSYWYGAGGFWGIHSFLVGGTATHLSLGADHACVLASDGDAKCWGANNVGQLGQGHIENMGDEVAEMGLDLPYVLFPEDTYASAVSAGGEHTCYLLNTSTTEGMPLCLGRINLLGYGWSDDGAVGDGYQEDASQMPDWPLPTGRHVDQIEAGWNHTCALFDDGSMGCWGDNTHGQLGTGNTSFLGDAADEVGDGLALVDLPVDATVTSMALGWDHTCVLYSTGDVACWGNNADGQLGIGSTSAVGDGAGEMGSNLVNISLPSGVNATSITAGDGFTCAVFSDESIRCWGRNDVGQLGQGNTATYGDNGGETVAGLSAIDLGSTYASGTKILDAGRDHVCSVIETSSTAGVIKCWGGNADGQLGVGDAGSDKHRGDQSGEMGSNLETLGTYPAFTGLDVGGLMRFEVGDRFACLMRLSDGTDTDPQVQCWGASSQGRLGYGNTETLGDSSTDALPNNDVQLKLNEAYAHDSCLGTSLPNQVEVDTADAARHVKVLADDDACPVIVYTDDDASSVLMAVYHNNRWVEETVFETSDDVVDLDAGIAPDGRVHVAWVEAYSSSSNYVHHASKSMGQWSSNQVFPGSDEVGMLLYPDGGIELVMIAATSNYIRSSISTDGGENWGLEISRDYGSSATWSDLNVALDDDGVAYASYNVDGTLRVISRPAGGDGVGADDWTAHVDVRSDLSDDGDVERQSLVSSVGALGGMLAVSANGSTGGWSNVSACVNGWSSCTTASDWTVDANLTGITSTTMAMAVDLDQNHYLASNSSNGLMLTRVGAAGTAPPSTTLWPHGVEEVDLQWSAPGVLHAAVRNASDGHLWLVRVDGFGGIGLNVDLDGDGWLGIDEQACGTDAHDASSTPSDADGDGLCDDVDRVDDEVHPRGSRTIALGASFGCAVTGNVTLGSSQPAVVCWGANDEKQVGNTSSTAASTFNVDVAQAVDLPDWTAVVDLDAGERHACTVTTEGEVFCWGANDHGQLGRDTGHASAFAGLVDLPDGVRALGVATGANHTCIHDQRGDVWCWGSNLKGQLGSHAFANPDGVVLLDSAHYPWLVSSWDQSSTNQFGTFVDGLATTTLVRNGCCNSPGTREQSLKLSVPMDATLVLNISAEDVDFGLDLYLDDVWVMGSGGATEVQSTWYNASVPVSAGEHTLEAKITYYVGSYPGWDDFLHLNAALHGIEIAEGGESSGYNLVHTLSNSTAPVMLLAGDHSISGLDAGQYETCATDANGNTTCWTGGAMSTSTTTPSADWQSAIANASTASGCGFTYTSNTPDPLDTTFVYPSGVAVGTQNAAVTVTNHTSLPIDCSGLRVGTATVGSVKHWDWEDMHVVPVEPGRTYLIDVFTEDKVGTDSNSERTRVRAFAPTSAVTQNVVSGQSSSQANVLNTRLLYTASWDQSLMIVGVERLYSSSSSVSTSLTEYNLKVTEVGGPHPDASLAYLYDSPLVKMNADSVALVGTPDVGLDGVAGQTCAVPLDGVGLICENSNFMTDPNHSINLQYEDDANRTTSFSMGQTTACAVLNGSLACWGNETVGGLGDGGNAVSTTATPVSVSLPTGWVPVEVEVSDFDERACALLRNATNDKRVYCWGPDAEGSLGNGGGLASTPTTAPNTPVQWFNDPLDVQTDSFELDRQPWDIVQLVADEFNNIHRPCVRSYEGLVKCWNTDLAFLNWENLDAENEMGQNLPFIDLGTEVYATDLSQFDNTNTCALLENGTVTCWGSASASGVHDSVPGYDATWVSANGDTRRVVGTGTSSGVLTDVVDVARNCALLSNGTVRCWTGSNARAHFEVDLGGALIASLHEAGTMYAPTREVCAIHTSRIRMTCFSSDAPASNVNTYTNEDGIHEGLRKVYQWPGNNGYSGTFMLSGSLTLTSSQNQVLKNADEVPLKPGSLTLGPNMHVCGIGPQSAPVCYDPDSDALVEYAPEDFGGRVLALDSDCVLRFDAEVLCRGFTDTRGVYTGSRLPHLDFEEAETVHLDLRNPDTDGDGVKDLWDDDDDGDGVLDHQDAFPRDACATTDTDRDGRPDALVAACSSLLTEDDDDDDDGWSDLDEGTCGTNPISNLHFPRDLDGDGTCDAADADMDGDGWDDADERMCSPQGTVLRSLPPAPVQNGDATVFLGGADRRTPMAALTVADLNAGTHLLDLTEDDPMAKALELSWYTDVSGHRASNLGSSVAFTAFGEPSSDGAISYILDVEDGTLVPRSIGDEDSGYALAPFLDADGEILVIKGSNTVLETLDGFSRDLTVPGNYPIQALMLENGSLLILAYSYNAKTEGTTSATGTFAASLSLLSWNHTFDAYETTAQGLPLPNSLTSGVNTLRGASGKMVADGEGQVHWIIPTVNSTNSGLIDHEHLIINGTAPYVHHVGAVTGDRLSNHNSNSFGLDWTPAGGLRMSYVLSNLSLAVSELNASGVVSTTVLPDPPTTIIHRSVGHATDTAGHSTVLVTQSLTVGETLLYAPPLRVDPAADASWMPVDADNDGVCDASLGAMLHFAEEDLLWEAGLFSAAEPLPFGGYEVTGVTALTSLPNGLVLNTTTGAISGTPTVAVPEGQNVTLRITSNGVTIDMVVLLRIAEPAMVSVGEFTATSSSSSPLNKVSHMVTTEDGRRYTLSWHSTDTTGKVNGFSHTSSDLALTGYRPNGSAVVNWTSNIRSYGWTYPLDLALDADGNPLVLFLAGSSSCSQTSCSSQNDIEFPNPEHDILASEACTTLYSSNTECQGWGERKKLVLASFGEEGLVQWTQHVMHRAGNSTYYNNPGEEGVSWSSYDARQTYSPDGRGMMDDDYLSIAPDGGINLAIQFCAEAPLVGTFGGHEI